MISVVLSCAVSTRDTVTSVTWSSGAHTSNDQVGFFCHRLSTIHTSSTIIHQTSTPALIYLLLDLPNGQAKVVHPNQLPA